jgi:Ca-activated chloride channel family protein
MEFLGWNSLWWLVVLVGLGTAFFFSLVDRPTRMKWLSFGFRIAAIVLIIFALCRPFWSSEKKEVHVAFLLDVSESVDVSSMKSALTKVRAGIDALDEGDSHGLFLFGKEVREVSLDEIETFIESCEKGRADADFRSSTDLDAAVSHVRLTLPADRGKRIILLTDGLLPNNPGGVFSQLEKEKTDVRVVALESLKKPEASITSFAAASPTAFQGEIARLKVKLGANRDMKAKLRILHRGVAVAEKQVQLKADDETVEYVEVEMVSSGDSVWEAHLEPDEDYFPNNNQASTTVSVSGQPRVLVIHEKPQQLREAARALREQGIEMDVRGARGLPDSLRGLLAFDAIMLADIPATSMQPKQMQWLKQYVSDFGGGLIMTGSENSFGLGGYFKTPVEDVLPLVSRFEKEKQKPSLAMVLVIDKSGSMSGNPIVLARQAARAAAELLSPQDQIAVIGFDSNPQLFLDLTPAGNQGAIAAAIDSIQASGGTDLAPAVAQAKDILAGASAKIKHVIAMTDGQTSQSNLLELCQEMADSGMTVSTVAMGQGASRELLAAMADAGKGRYYETDSPENVPQIFTKETMQASKSAIKEDLYAVAPIAEHPMILGYEAAEFPMILGYVMTRVKPTAQLLLAAESGDPLLATGQFGLGTGVAFTADLTDRWGSEWLTWDGFGPFWAQVIRGALKKDDSVGLSAQTRVEGGQWKIDIRRLNDAGAPVNGIDWQAQAFDADGNTTPVTVKETGLGRYQASVPITGDRMALQLTDAVHAKMKTLQWSRGYPDEYRLASEFKSNVLGKTNYEPTEVRAGIAPINVKSTAIPLFGFLALGCLFLSVLFRRI